MHPYQYDVDWMAVTISLTDLNQLFDRSTIVQMAGARPPFKDDPFYKEWITVVSQPFILSIPPSRGVREGIIEGLYRDHGIIVRGSDSPNSTIQGRQHVALDTLIGTLSECVEGGMVRIVQYGMKAYWETMAAKDAVYESSGGRSNTFDIGLMIRSMDIPVLRGRDEAGDETFPMFGPLGKGFGSVSFDEGLVSVTVYPRIVHALKAYASNISMKTPKVMRSLRGRKETLGGLRRWLRGNMGKLGGVRIEARVQAPTVAAAIKVVEGLKILDLETVVGILGEESVRLVQVEDYLRNLDEIWIAAKERVFRGSRDTQAVTPEQAQRFRDVLNAFGFNPGWRKRQAPTITKDGAWWLSPEAGLPPAVEQDPRAELEELYSQYGAQLRCECGGSIFHKVGGKKEFRLRCARYTHALCSETWRANQIRDRIEEVIRVHREAEDREAQEREAAQQREAGDSARRDQVAEAKEDITARAKFRKHSRGERWNWVRGSGLVGSTWYGSIEECVDAIWEEFGENWEQHVMIRL
ncbi:uncharacterized protein EV422DRAFT_570367 [Fimicolochytrium jonesii]|uniref:uncharacterized protein n=1 Tax=Fimicolochytrium jonesii TaxID=1396493 RepID=UPI0022FDE66D|nr:uncharacterized protein EV422DRAFT_570366 [Fimicolochytrium jonesii]XP_052922862.1 uncharacterized protein EV422DRAFT_570367 [Fimicolochytrium jonesii]KAI8817892.1 hypothetical protein EV422DRAFT_570366 [Fimicolochytrium jonesii]KAI8817893.1 hypothetical protein EV422DRAFT_570367 [Fimicolochytrium jonesii]